MPSRANSFQNAPRSPAPVFQTQRNYWQNQYLSLPSDRFCRRRPTIQAVSRRSDPQTAVAAPVPAIGLPSNEERARELSLRAANGDLAATQELLAYVWPTLTRVAAGVLGARHAELDDAVQQSMIALVRALPAFRGECHPAGYASRITLRVALRMRKGSKRDANRRETLGQLAPPKTAPPP